MRLNVQRHVWIYMFEQVHPCCLRGQHETKYPKTRLDMSVRLGSPLMSRTQDETKCPKGQDTFRYIYSTTHDHKKPKTWGNKVLRYPAK